MQLDGGDREHRRPVPAARRHWPAGPHHPVCRSSRHGADGRTHGAPFGVAVHSAGGFNGVTGKHALAENIVEHWNEFGRDTIVMHIGDHDPSGEHVYLNLERDVSAFVDAMGEEKAWSHSSALR